MADYEIVIGLEVHVQLLTRSKMFCSCSAAYQDAEPNTEVCPVCLGLPGVLPVINRKAVEYVVRTGLALNCRIAEVTKFDRKNYPYPDLMKGYQISQYDLPVAEDGYLMVNVGEGQRRIGVTRVHLEEDVAKLLHRTEPHGEGYSLLDVNRAGVALMEIVSEPDMRSPEEARNYLIQLRSIVQYIGVGTANMEEGSFRCDANISVRPFGAPEYGRKVEIKNMNSLRGVFRALEYEAGRQQRAAAEGETIYQETRGWNDERGVTVPQRSKEYAHDYRYFPEPDLPPIALSRDMVAEVRAGLPELPEARKTRFVSEFELSAYDASQLTASRAMADYFEAVVEGAAGDRTALAKSTANWMLSELQGHMNAAGVDIEAIKINPSQIVELLALVDSGTLNSTMAKTVFDEMFETGGAPKEIAEALGLVQISDADAIASAVSEAIQNNPNPVKDYLGGKETALRFLVGQVMKLTRGKANPQMASELLRERLEMMR